MQFSMRKLFYSIEISHVINLCTILTSILATVAHVPLQLCAAFMQIFSLLWSVAMSRDLQLRNRNVGHFVLLSSAGWFLYS